MVLQALHRVWPPIIDYCGDLAAELGHPVQANAYITPPQNQGFSNHYDVHDVFVLQIAGEKEWTIHAPVHPAPLRDQPWTDRRAAVEQRAGEAPLIQTVLSPGDCLYLPRGFLHAARACGGVSSHLTLGVHTWTRYTLAESLLAAGTARGGQRSFCARIAAHGSAVRAGGRLVGRSGARPSEPGEGPRARRRPDAAARSARPRHARDNARRPSARSSSYAQPPISTLTARSGSVIICCPPSTRNGDRRHGAAQPRRRLRGRRRARWPPSKIFSNMAGPTRRRSASTWPAG